MDLTRRTTLAAGGGSGNGRRTASITMRRLVPASRSYCFRAEG